MNRFVFSGLALCSLMLTACNSNPAPPREDRKAMSTDVSAAVQKMQDKDPSLREFLDRAYGYAIFPDIGKGALVVGGAYGKGEVYRGNKFVGYADLKAGSVGLQAGGATFSELLVFATPKVFNEFTAGKFSFGADASAVALTAGAASKAQFQNGVAVFVLPRGGAIVDLSVSGQKFDFRPGTRDMPENAPTQP